MEILTRPRGSDELARLLVDRIENLIVVLDAEGRVVRFNRHSEKVTGYTEAQLLGTLWWEKLELPAERERLAATYPRTNSDGIPSSHHRAWLTADGRGRLISWTTVCLVDAEGRLDYLIGTGIDISEQAQAERLNAAIVQASLDCLIVIDFEGRIAEWNPAAERTFGYERREALGRPVHELVIPERMRETYRIGVQALLEGGSDLPLMGSRTETLGIRRSGEEFPLELATTVWGSGPETVLIASVRDLSDREEAAVARQASEAQSRFLATMSHELRAPLNSILGFSQLLDGGRAKLDEKQRRYVANISASGHHLLDLINDVLDLAKVRAGHVDLNCSLFEVSEVMEASAAKLNPLAAAAGLTLTFKTSRLRTHSDRRRMEQIVLNLLSNAIKFTPSGGTVKVTARAAANDRLEIAVADSGIGIPLEDQERIFDEFAQVDSSMSRAEAGTGLGLALCRQLAHVMGGEVRVASLVGRGSTFTLNLPVGTS
jgi:protein-histidine pros-kinase